MTDRLPSGDRSRMTRIIKAPRQAVYRAFLDPEAVAAWLAPDNMQGQVHSFEAREGGQFRISLRYLNTADAELGKSAAGTDTYHGRFVRLVPDELIVEAIEFETAAPEFAGEMTMTVRLAEAEGGTEVSLAYENVPPGIRPEDNEVGSRSALAKLAALVERA
jgi:uncharacterized protein YndB with AHSA1/START domain